MALFGKNKSKQQETAIITAKGILERDTLEAGTQCMARPNEYEAWELDFNQQVRYENDKKGRFVQFVSSLNKQPLQIYSNRPRAQSQSTQNIAAQQFDEKLVQIREKSQKSSMLLWLEILMVLLALIITIPVYVIIKGG